MKKWIALGLALMMALCGTSAFAETSRHERVYVVAGADGTVKSLTDSIRLENRDGLDEIADRTMLTGIQNVSGTESFTLDGESLTWKAEGKDIVYQGTSDKTPDLLPVVTLTLDGETVTADELENRTGEAVLTVSYQTPEKQPALALTILPLPEEGISDLKLENAFLFSEMGRQILAGWAVPGLDEALKLPASFTVSFHADHVRLPWMMTLASFDPLDLAYQELEKRIPVDPHTELQEITSLLTALQNGETLPVVSGKANLLVAGINTLNDSLTQLNDGAVSLVTGADTLAGGAAGVKDGAASLASGAASLSEGAAGAETGAASLEEGLTALTGSNETLNAGAQALFEGILRAANQQLAASGLDQAGLTLPELTAENYAEVLQAALDQLSSDAVKDLPMAQAARESLAALKEQLDQTSQFVTGLKAYTAGTEQAAAGAATLHTGLTSLNTGAAQLSQGAATLSAGAVSLNEGAATLQTGVKTLQETGTQKIRDTILTVEKTAAGWMLPYVQNDLTKALSLYDELHGSVENAGYDLRPEGMRTVTLYVIRTDLH